MARSRRVVMQEIDEPQDLGATDAVAEEEAAVVEADVLAGLRELEGAGAIRWDISRLSTEPGRNGYLATWLTAQLTKEALRDQFGGGKYRIVGKNPNGTYAAMRTIDVADDAPVRGKRMESGVTIAGGSSSGVQDVLAIIREERAKSSENYLKWAAILVPALTPVLQGMFGGKKEGINELVTALASMKQLQGGEESKLDQFVKMFELAQTVGGGKGGGETNWLDVLKEGLGIARPALENVIQSAAHRLPASPSNVPAPNSLGSSQALGFNPAPASDAKPVLTSPDNGGDPMLKLLPWLKNQLEFLIVQAARDRDPEVYAVLLVDNIPDGVPAERIVEMLARSDWWTMLCTFHPGVAPYLGWFSTLRTAVVAEIQGTEGGEPGMPEESRDFGAGEGA